MPIQLTTSVDVGVADPNSPLQQAKILLFTMYPNDSRIELVVQHGNTISDNWVSGTPIEGVTVKRFVISGTDYATMVSAASAAVGEVYYDKVAALLYQWLLDSGHYVGAVA